jgi:tetratricopeptide (TPR) repeat protein
MRYILILFVILGLSLESFSQSSLFQTGTQSQLDHSLELFDKQLFSASLFDHSSLLNQNLDSEQSKTAELHRAMAALETGRPDGVGLMKSYILDHSSHPSVATAGVYLGDHFFYKKDYKQALEGYQLVKVSNLPVERKADILFKQGYAYFQLKNSAQAAAVFDQVKTLKQPISFDAAYYSGFIASEAGNTTKAIADLKQAAQTAFYQGKVPYLLAGLYYKEKNYPQLISYSEPILNSKLVLDRKEIIHLYLAEAYFEQKEFAKAASNYDLFIASKKGDLSRSERYKAGVSQFEIGQYQRASDYFKTTASATDEIGQASSYYLGHSYLKIGNSQFASTSFNEAAKGDFNLQIKEEALFNFAKTNLQKGSFQTGIIALDEYLDAYPASKNKSEAENLLSEALINTNDYLRAIDQMEKIKSKSARIQGAYQKVAFYQAMVYYRDQKWSQAILLLDKSLTFQVDRQLALETNFWKGEVYAASGDLSKSIRAYEAALAGGKTTSSAYLTKSLYGLGYAYFNSQNYSKAEEYFKTYTDRLKTRENKENYEDALLRLGDCYYVQKRFSEASTIFQRAIAESNSNADYALYRSAVVFNFQSQNQQAINQLNTLIDKFPSSLYIEDAIFQRGQILMEETQYAEASKGFSQLISTRSNSPFLPFALEGRAVANFSLRNYDQTINDYKTILEKYATASNAENALKGLQEALALQGRSSEFGEYLEEYKGSNPASGSVQALEFEAAKSLYFDKRFTQATRALENFLRSYPQSAQRSEALYFLGDSYFQSGETEKALMQFRYLEKEPASPQRLRAMQRIGTIELGRGNFSSAIPYLQLAADNARNKLEEVEAVKGLMLANFEIKQFVKAIASADRLLTLDGVVPESTPTALLTKAKSQRELNQRAEAETTLISLVNEYNTVQGAEGLFWLAFSFHENGDFSRSNDTIFDFSSSFADHDYWYGRLFLLLAENYEKTGESFQAKATLQSIVDNSVNSEIKSMAQAKLKNLN